jgi:hypothetical protein
LPAASAIDQDFMLRLNITDIADIRAECFDFRFQKTEQQAIREFAF